ncbi:hypothetical protein DIPPA_15097 [Diplonema papillatum]|nr:hypothetical protein DIPPA_15097 [Diplonema papillatum]
MAVVGKVISMSSAPMPAFQKYPVHLQQQMQFMAPYNCAYNPVGPVYPYKHDEEDVEVEAAAWDVYAQNTGPYRFYHPMAYAAPQRVMPEFSSMAVERVSEPTSSEADCSHRGRTPEPMVTASARSRSATSSNGSNENCSVPRPRCFSEPPITMDDDFE